MYKISLVHKSLSLIAIQFKTMHNKGCVCTGFSDMKYRFNQVIQNHDISKIQHKTRMTTLTADTSMHVNIASVVSYSIYSVDSGSA